MKLTAQRIIETKAREVGDVKKPTKFADGHGLYLYVAPGGGKLWRLSDQRHSQVQTSAAGPRVPYLKAFDEAEGKAALSVRCDHGSTPCSSSDSARRSREFSVSSRLMMLS